MRGFHSYLGFHIGLFVTSVSLSQMFTICGCFFSLTHFFNTFLTSISKYTIFVISPFSSLHAKLMYKEERQKSWETVQYSSMAYYYVHSIMCKLKQILKKTPYISKICIKQLRPFRQYSSPDLLSLETKRLSPKFSRFCFQKHILIH